jgi:hypothetical protein
MKNTYSFQLLGTRVKSIYLLQFVVVFQAFQVHAPKRLMVNSIHHPRLYTGGLELRSGSPHY